MTLFTTCINGHDLTGPDAFIYTANGNRRCRACAYEEWRGKKRPKQGDKMGLFV